MLDTQIEPLVNQAFEPLVGGDLASNFLHPFRSHVFGSTLHATGVADLPVGPGAVLGILVLAGERAGTHRANLQQLPWRTTDPVSTSGSLLFGDGPATDIAFINLRDATTELQFSARGFTERLWDTFREHADEHFLTEVRIDFNSRFWEMYLTCALLDCAQERDFRVTCPKPGPDVCVEFRGRRIWVEAIAATNGMPGNPDTLVEPALGGRIPEEKIVLRYTSAILEKYRKYGEYLQKGIVDKDDVYIIAVNTSRLAFRWASAEVDLPRFLKAVYPIGQLEFVIDLQEQRNARLQNRSRFSIRKANNQEVLVQTFIDTSWSGLSAVICSDADASSSRMPLGSDFQIAYNPLAHNPAPAGVIPACREWFSRIDGEVGELYSNQQLALQADADCRIPVPSMMLFRAVFPIIVCCHCHFREFSKWH